MPSFFPGRILVFALGVVATSVLTAAPEFVVERFLENPIITPAMMGRVDENINGPSLIKVPDWLPNKLGTYYLYFGNHQGQYIRLAYANDLHGPWKIHQPGVLTVKETGWNPSHVASPDAFIDEERHEIRLYFHAPISASNPATKGVPIQQDSFVAVSKDGLHFTIHPESLGPSYFRVWRQGDYFYAMAGFGSPLERSKDGFAPFERAPRGPFQGNPAFRAIRHVALFTEKDVLTVFYTQTGDAPERLFATEIEMKGDWTTWHATLPTPLLAPQTGYEGVALPIARSQGGAATEPEHALRDPAVYREGDHLYLLYSVEGERGIAIAELHRRANSK